MPFPEKKLYRAILGDNLERNSRARTAPYAGAIGCCSRWRSGIGFEAGILQFTKKRSDSLHQKKETPPLVRADGASTIV